MSEDIIINDSPAAAEIRDRVLINENGSVTYHLEFPVTVKYRSGNQEREETISEVTFRRVNGKDLRTIAGLKDEGEIMAKIFTNLSNQPMAVFDQMDGKDIEAAFDAISDFFPKPPQTGRTT